MKKLFLMTTVCFLVASTCMATEQFSMEDMEDLVGLKYETTEQIMNDYSGEENVTEEQQEAINDFYYNNIRGNIMLGDEASKFKNYSVAMKHYMQAYTHMRNLCPNGDGHGPACTSHAQGQRDYLITRINSMKRKIELERKWQEEEVEARKAYNDRCNNWYNSLIYRPGC